MSVFILHALSAGIDKVSHPFLPRSLSQQNSLEKEVFLGFLSIFSAAFEIFLLIGALFHIFRSLLELGVLDPLIFYTPTVV